jgi:ferredoxin-thioredoxin reductase catalytic chain
VSENEGLPEIGDEEIAALYERLDTEAEKGGYHLNPEPEFTLGLIRGILVNEKRYGYWLCPCRLSDGSKQEDLDIICPCDYRDADLEEYGCCFCSLYVSQEVLEGSKSARRIPERRPEDRAQRLQFRKPAPGSIGGAAGEAALSHPVWRCRVCGYLCARDSPPEVCPICRAKKERFERFL